MNNHIADTFTNLHRDSRTKTLGFELRRHALIQLRLLIEENEALILEALARDLGKPVFEAYTSEIYLVLKEISTALKKLKKWMRPKSVAAGLLNLPAKAKIHSRPKGVVLIISPWNYPFQLLLSPLVGALAAGNRVILKPSEVAIHTSNLVAKLIPRYFPDEIVSVIEGGIPETEELLRLPFDHIFYTGNAAVGRIVMKAAAENLTPLTLELGGKSPAVVWGRGDIQVTARRVVWGKMLNCAQTCVAPDYVLCSPAQLPELLRAMKEELEKMKSPAQIAGRIINERHFERLEHLLADQSIEVLVDGVRERSTLQFGLHIVKAKDSSLCMKDEIFGPILPIVEVNSFDEALRFINKRDRPLAAYIFSSEDEYVERFRENVISGGMCVRDTIVHLTSEELPFGGVGPSGMGNYHGEHSFKTFSHEMSVLERQYRFDLALRYPPYGKVAQFALRILRFLSKF